MEILAADRINEIIKRIAIEIVENNFEEKKIYLAGINNNGHLFAKIIATELKKISDQDFELIRIRLNPADPTNHDVSLSIETKSLKNKVLIIVDDVANTGRTIFYAFRPILDILCKKVQVAVLVDRKHKSFPVEVDYVGISLATTLKEDIQVKLNKKTERTVSLV